MTTESHICVLRRPYPWGIMACACGQYWMPAPRDIRQFAFVSSALRERLHRYQLDVKYWGCDSLADAVARHARREREEREAARIKARYDWPRLQAAKRAKWWRCVREIMLTKPCAYCGGPAATLDHITPRCRGGSDKMRNLAPACKRCNSEKWRHTVDEWKAWRLRRGRPWPPPPSAAAA